MQIIVFLAPLNYLNRRNNFNLNRNLNYPSNKSGGGREFETTFP